MPVEAPHRPAAPLPRAGRGGGRRLIPLLAAGALRGAPAAADPPAAPPGGAGRLTVTAPVPGAEVWIDDQPAGAAPLSRELPPGAHLIRVYADGYLPYVFRVDVAADRPAELRAVLVPGGGTVEVQADAPGAVLTVDGGRELPLPVRLTDLTPGEHRYRVSAPGRVAVDGRFLATPGKNLFLPHSLPRVPTTLRVETRPPAARVRLDGVDLGPAPLAAALAPGPHLLELQHPAHPRLWLRISAEEGQQIEQLGELPDEGARVRVRTGSADAAVSVDGVEVGRGRHVDLGAVARGRYALAVEGPAGVASGRLDVGSRGAHTLVARFPDPGARGAATVTELPPWYGRWAVWTAVGAGSALLLTGGLLIRAALQPEPAPTGDLVVTLP